MSTCPLSRLSMPSVAAASSGGAAAGKLRCVDEFVDVVVETPRSSRNIYEADQQGMVRFDRRLPGSFA